MKVWVDWHEGPIIINQRDFDPERHKFDEATAAHAAFGSTAPEFTREDIAGMGKADVRELLDLHGVDVPKGTTVGTMRDMLTRVMFVDL